MKTITTSVVLAIIIIGGAILLGGGNNKNSNDQNTNPSQIVNNVSVIDGKQIIEIRAKGGYSPRTTTAKADIPTVIKIETQGTFDCSSALVIPSLGYRENLPPSGETLIDLPPQKAGSKLQGLCTMGMYNFIINFE
ncbi:MAG: hypothetical protein Athens071416_115 [Parcubacteria group bacterium Athens0714_16]|nr:MAG: hypothetical protein Athens071416_115 [Parcubacteria group bacterium Athens0714_16]